MVYFGPYDKGIACSQISGVAKNMLNNFIKSYAANFITRQSTLNLIKDLPLKQIYSTVYFNTTTTQRVYSTIERILHFSNLTYSLKKCYKVPIILKIHLV